MIGKANQIPSKATCLTTISLSHWKAPVKCNIGNLVKWNNVILVMLHPDNFPNSCDYDSMWLQRLDWSAEYLISYTCMQEQTSSKNRRLNFLMGAERRRESIGWFEWDKARIPVNGKSNSCKITKTFKGKYIFTQKEFKMSFPWGR